MSRSLPMPTLLAHTHTQVPRFSQLNPRQSACIFSETDDSPSCICQQSSMRPRTLPMSTSSSFTHTHRFLGSRNSTPGILPAFSARLFCILCVPDDRDSACVPSPSLSPRSHAPRSHIQNRFLGFRNSTSARLMSAPTLAGSMYSNSMYDAQHSV